ncbi:hypothetical protein MMC11_006404 [Xylographa trunciseda]|nr:hypothetical protein [Xylographa trunciseda]
MPSQYNVGVIGYGMSAKVFHLPLISVVPELKLYSIVQRSPKPGDDAEKDYPDVKIYRSGEEMIQDEVVDVVLVLTTPGTHYDLSKLALESGKHVVVEKPFTPTSKEAHELIAIAKKHQRLLTVYQNRRWDVDFLTLSEMIRNKTLGRIVEFETHFDRYRPEVGTGWKTKPSPGGGVVYDLGTHLMDQVVFTFGMPTKITGFIGSQREHNPDGFEDSCTVLLHYDGMLATVKASVISLETAQLRYWVRGQKGSYKKYFLDGQEDELKRGRKPGDPEFGVEPKERYGMLTTMEGEAPSTNAYATVKPLTYGAFYTQFTKALKGEGEVPVDPEVPAEVIRLVELARQSSREGKTLSV